MKLKYMKKHAIALLIQVLLGVHALPSPAFSAETELNVTFYDEAEDLAFLAQHENESMHFKLLNSKVLNETALWGPFEHALTRFTEQDYFDLKQFIIDRSINEIQRAVNSGSLSYEELVTFYIYRIQRIESDNNRFINSIISLNPDAINRARQLDEIRQSGSEAPLDSLFGIPVLLLIDRPPVSYTIPFPTQATCLVLFSGFHSLTSTFSSSNLIFMFLS